MANTALLVGDIQNGIVGMILPDAEKQKAYLDSLASTIAAARKAGVKIVYVRVALRKGYPDVSDDNIFFGPIKQAGIFTEDEAATQIHEAVAPQEGDAIVIKRRVGAFTQTDLDLVLRSQNVKHLVLTGLSTSGIILSTVRVGSDLDYVITVLSDLVADNDEEAHKVLIEKIFPKQAAVEDSKTWIGKL